MQPVHLQRYAIKTIRAASPTHTTELAVVQRLCERMLRGYAINLTASQRAYAQPPAAVCPADVQGLVVYQSGWVARHQSRSAAAVKRMAGPQAAD